MTRWRRWALVTGILALCGGIAIANLRARAAPTVAAVSTPTAALHGTDIFPKGMHRAPAFSLHDQNGKPFSLSNLRQHVTALTFLDAHCTKACPIAGQGLARTQRMLGAYSALDIVVIDIHPGVDTPASARTFMKEMGMRRPWHWLFGSRAYLQSVWREYGILVKPVPGDILHTAAMYLIGPDASIRIADSIPFLPEQLAGSVRAIEAGR
ncbi:MAG: hypothetical protein NVSMB52_00370 [Chloroflexota bacterium]